MKQIPNFDVITEKGSVTLVFQTTSHKCLVKFVNEKLIITIDGIVCFETGK